MSYEPILGEIALYSFDYAPRGWAFCDGQIMGIAQNPALFALLGTNYGGNGETTFALPNLNGRVPVGTGQGPGLSYWQYGQVSGVESVTLTSQQLPNHLHVQGSSSGAATSGSPGTHVPATSELQLHHAVGSPTGSLAPAGGSQPHNNMQPYLTLRYAIALAGVFPMRN